MWHTQIENEKVKHFYDFNMDTVEAAAVVTVPSSGLHQYFRPQKHFFFTEPLHHNYYITIQ